MKKLLILALVVCLGLPSLALAQKGGGAVPSGIVLLDSTAFNADTCTAAFKDPSLFDKIVADFLKIGATYNSALEMTAIAIDLKAQSRCGVPLTAGVNWGDAFVATPDECYGVCVRRTY